MIPVRPGVLFDPTGKVGNPAARIVCEDTFERDSRGWVQLRSTGAQLAGTVSRIVRGGPHIQVRTPALGGVSTMAIKRMSQVYGRGRYLVEFLTHAEDTNLDRTRPRYREFGLDTGRETDGARWFNVFRWNIYDENAAAQVNRWEYQTTGGAWVAIPGGGTFTVNGGFWPTNENKKLPFYLAMEFDTHTGAYLGFRFGDTIKVGSLADAPDDNAFGGAVAGGSPTDLDIFADGLNPFFGVVNRGVGVNATAACQGVEWHRTTFISRNEAG